MKKECLCHSGWDYEECCGPVLRGEENPAKAEDLMRARYSAYVEGKIDFIVDSTWPAKRDELDLDHIREWSKNSTWQDLEILEDPEADSNRNEQIVEFKAYYLDADGQEVIHHERSLFRREEGRWYFVDGKPGRQEPIRRESPKIGRNDPCPCGSGKKYKKCCGLKSRA